MRRLAEQTGIPLADMLFVGDRLDPDGNDYPVLAMGVACHAVEGWEDTAEYLEALIPTLPAADRRRLLSAEHLGVRRRRVGPAPALAGVRELPLAAVARGVRAAGVG